MKPFRFGVIVRSARSRAEWVDQARKLEDLGYSSLTVPDHLAESFAPMPALVSAAAATKTIRVGTTVPNNDFRHRSEEHTSELQSLAYLVCRLLLEKKKNS